MVTGFASYGLCHKSKHNLHTCSEWRVPVVTHTSSQASSVHWDHPLVTKGERQRHNSMCGSLFPHEHSYLLMILQNFETQGSLEQLPPPTCSENSQPNLLHECYSACLKSIFKVFLHKRLPSLRWAINTGEVGLYIRPHQSTTFMLYFHYIDVCSVYLLIRGNKKKYFSIPLSASENNCLKN